MPGVTQLSLPRLGFAIQAAGPMACVLSHLCLKSRCGTISPGMENFVTQKVGHVSARRALPVFSLCGTLCFSSADYVPSFPECPQELPPSPECRAPSGKKALEDVGIASHQRERGGDRLRCPPLHVQAGAGREARTSSKRRAPRPEQERPRKRVAQTEPPLSTGRARASVRPAVTVARAGPGPRWL